MALTESRWQRVLMLCALYVAQGVPWGFMFLTLPPYLAENFKVGTGDIGDLKAVILLPWAFKLIWAPLMESYTIRSMGRRRPWIIGAELMMALTLLGFLFAGDPAKNLNYLIAMYFIHNCFASLQDVCTDALAVDVLPPDEQGRTNGFMWGAKLVGKGIGGWGLSHVLHWGGIEACVYVQLVILLGIMTVPLWLLERPGEKRLPWSQGVAAEMSNANVRPTMEVLRDVLKAFSIPTLIIYFVFTLTKLIGVGINEVVTDTLYTQQLMDWDDKDISRVKGLYGIIPVIVCTALGGYLGDRYGRRYILAFGFGGYALITAIFAGCPQMWNERWFAVSFLIACETLYAIGSVGFLSMAMRISWTTAAATVFTVYMTLSNISHIIGHKLAGPIQESFMSGTGQASMLKSYELTFWCVAVLSALPLLLLPWVLTKEVDEAKDKEPPEAETVPA